eukprot:600166-Rhodomonas_salina.2
MKLPTTRIRQHLLSGDPLQSHRETAMVTEAQTRMRSIPPHCRSRLWTLAAVQEELLVNCVTTFLL